MDFTLALVVDGSMTLLTVPYIYYAVTLLFFFFLPFPNNDLYFLSKWSISADYMWSFKFANIMRMEYNEIRALPHTGKIPHNFVDLYETDSQYAPFCRFACFVLWDRTKTKSESDYWALLYLTIYSSEYSGRRGLRAWAEIARWMAPLSASVNFIPDDILFYKTTTTVVTAIASLLLR